MDVDAAGLQAYADELQARFMALQSEALDLHERTRAVEVTEKSANGLVSATVGAGGELIRLDLDPRVFRDPDARGLADTITDTIHRAAAKAQDKVVEIFESVVPADQMRAHLDGDIETVMKQLAGQMVEGDERR
ncbi:YbaB/EbfC family nucleoid-associated protein [Nonomuraea sp. 3-1Str]|uniref:YbaB/EbfC family nucleoid-associated protein n=1 Tax=unclassified Nonomuraea TaxID=2593643 RepID=UPI00285AFBF7|nr:YbaB/EbfC family nucleoid-associated protein [Nonomuraea sp. 3-1Str]MDR8408559.1 YbaB/EbfC family nucleoid-associated protein [Nonomuraea sp. 3-1Str]